jgi:hypothetical protein
MWVGDSFCNAYNLCSRRVETKNERHENHSICSRSNCKIFYNASGMPFNPWSVSLYHPEPSIAPGEAQANACEGILVFSRFGPNQGSPTSNLPSAPNCTNLAISRNHSFNFGPQVQSAKGSLAIRTKYRWLAPRNSALSSRWISWLGAVIQALPESKALAAARTRRSVQRLIYQFPGQRIER